jgi:3,4-dihydroxy 2-butanone 4-phosphate synthase/GTP cyclohydrolase II
VSFEEIISASSEIIADAKVGRMVVLVDDEDRENEGDLVVPASWATPETINFMAKNGRGLICLAMERLRVEALGLPLMSQRNGTRHQTAFTVSIEAREGVTTGISAYDRAHTIKVAIDPRSDSNDLVTPGHIFPLVARDGGVLVRAGHTEAAVDIARLAGLVPAGVICEIMNEDGSMARRDDLIRFAQLHGLKIGTISDLIAYRRRYDRIVERTLETRFDSRFGGEFALYVYTNRIAHSEHVALVKGDLHTDDPVLVRMHALNVLNDVLGDLSSGRGEELHASMLEVAREGRGVIVLIREPSPTSLSDAVRSRVAPKPALENAAPAELRDYGVGAQILLDLGVRRMVLLSNRKKTIIGLDGYGLSVIGERPIPPGSW